MENEILKRIQDYALEGIMGDRFGKYAKEIILDRAIPDVRDGLNQFNEEYFMQCIKQEIPPIKVI